MSHCLVQFFFLLKKKKGVPNMGKGRREMVSSWGMCPTGFWEFFFKYYTFFSFFNIDPMESNIYIYIFVSYLLKILGLTTYLLT